MTTVMIADFSGMAPIRDGLLLPDNVAQYAENAWCYRGEVRGFRTGTIQYTLLYSDTQQVYRIPKDVTKPLDFSTTGSVWLEYPDPYMATIRNPTVGDQYHRYYFFPSDQYKSLGDNPAWPTTSPGPMYNSFDQTTDTFPHAAYTLGILEPNGGPVTVTPAGISATTTATANALTGATTISVASTAGILVGMQVQDANYLKVTAPATAATAVGADTITFGSTTGVLVGMTVKDQNADAALLSGTQVSSLTSTVVTTNFTVYSPGVTIGDVILFENVNQIPAGATVTAIGSGTITISTGTVHAGVLSGDTLRFATSVSTTRSYVYTYVSQYGEEGPPSPATVATGDGTGTWTVTIPTPTPGDFTNRNLSLYRLYRTITDSSGNATYYQVTVPGVPINLTGPVTITDSAPDSTIVANSQLSTIGYTPPPPGLQGVVMMANGIAAGFTNEREVWFSAPYYPHAWPAAYALTVDYPIVGLTANGTSLNIITEGSPFIATGVTPDTMTIGKITAFEPCISRGSIVASGEGAYYASPNGLQLLNTGGTQNVTLPSMEKEFFNNLQPVDFASGRYGAEYIAFLKNGATIPPIYDGNDGDENGFIIAVQSDQSPNEMFSYLQGVPAVNLYPDEISGQLFEVTATDIRQVNPPIGVPGTTTLRNWKWMTKDFRFPHKQQFKALMVLFEKPSEVGITPGARHTAADFAFDSTSMYLLVRVFHDGQQVVVREIQNSGEVLLIPGGFKSELWRFQFEGQVIMKFFKVASSVRELRAT